MHSKQPVFILLNLEVCSKFLISMADNIWPKKYFVVNEMCKESLIRSFRFQMTHFTVCMGPFLFFKFGQRVLIEGLDSSLPMIPCTCLSTIAACSSSKVCNCFIISRESNDKIAKSPPSVGNNMQLFPLKPRDYGQQKLFLSEKELLGIYLS